MSLSPYSSFPPVLTLCAGQSHSLGLATLLHLLPARQTHTSPLGSLLFPDLLPWCPKCGLGFRVKMRSSGRVSMYRTGVLGRDTQGHTGPRGEDPGDRGGDRRLRPMLALLITLPTPCRWESSRTGRAFRSLRRLVWAPCSVPQAVAPSSQPRPASRPSLTSRGSTPFSPSCPSASSIWVLVCALISCDRRVVFGDPLGAWGTVSRGWSKIFQLLPHHRP